MSRAFRYANGNDDDDLEGLTNRLMNDLRNHIKTLV